LRTPGTLLGFAELTQAGGLLQVDVFLIDAK